MHCIYIITIAVGDKYMARNGFSIMGMHIDLPCLKVCGLEVPLLMTDREWPIIFISQSNHKKKHEGYLQVGCELPMQIMFEVHR
ncbi:hypothetical protein BC938DRAFT_471659 [Jimgerdemannia flammicorona]|uniref:Uncharacterized protein n=1 Tax=Jimgerdemannia flammicorona TaxID=994334 RepID=A0A433Q7P2_9FUNG|nr:hypothetical protein BC938DRAFT_471659 [Jimgerdemannia flammicorona]